MSKCNISEIYIIIYNFIIIIIISSSSVYNFLKIFLYIYTRGVNFNALTHVINLKTLTR